MNGWNHAGLFTGCSLALFISFFFLVENQHALGYGQHDAHEYLETVFPVFRCVPFLLERAQNSDMAFSFVCPQWTGID